MLLLTNMDYLLGRNATGYCFVTGTGFKSPMRPHHRPSIADGIEDPVPGLLVGALIPGCRTMPIMSIRNRKQLILIPMQLMLPMRLLSTGMRRLFIYLMLLRHCKRKLITNTQSSIVYHLIKRIVLILPIFLSSARIYIYAGATDCRYKPCYCRFYRPPVLIMQIFL